ncbi:MAG: hypothetical protein LBS45_00935 [Synergistaceae bacterium]|jgi:hypothetical protein|nr:hypothetical protein [Synergistaceae bacterium]
MEKILKAKFTKACAALLAAIMITAVLSGVSGAGDGGAVWCDTIVEGKSSDQKITPAGL